jgi:hypothetical protein
MSNTIGWGKGSLNNSIGWGQGGFEYAETIVNISSAQILAMGTTPIELLPAAGANKYYDWYAIIEMTPGTTKYTCADDILVGDSSSYFGQILFRTLIDDADLNPSVIQISSKSGQNEIQGGAYVVSYKTMLNRPVEMLTYNATNPTLGDGTMRVKVYYKTITFGA